ncbi:MAG: serine/threonine protein kinase [Chitinispirillaceae bacterium]|nr:serine/threonine protein kinase [Chitinispirillaceae bacterium]
MAQHGSDSTDGSKGSQGQGLPKVTRVRNAVILPDGSKKEPLGSGTITGLLGVGGMANVYEIWNSQLEMTRAVKLLHPNYTEEALQRFQTEIKITAKLNHRNIIEIHTVGHWNGLPFIEMERIYGDTLEKVLEDRGALPLAVSTAIAIMIGRALHYAHTQDYVIYGTTYHGVIHRDLKPSNIMVTGDGIVKLMDFGIARPTDASIHTTDGSILGTMQYLSPEQLDGKEPDIRADIYSLGTILYEMITGIKAFPENNVSKLMLNKIKNEFRPLNEYALAIPSRLRRLVHRCMVYDREKRIRTAQEFLTEIGRIHRSICGHSPEQVVRDYLREQAVVHTEVETRRSLPVRGIAGAAGLIVVVVLVLTGLKMRSGVSSMVEDTDIPPKPETLEVPLVVDEPVSVLEPGGVDTKMPVKTDAAVQRKDAALRGKEPVATGTVKKVVASVRSREEQLQEQYGAATLFDAFGKAVNRQAWKDALELSGMLPVSDARSSRGVVYRARVLDALGNKGDLEKLLSGTSVEDGELYLIRSKLALNRGDLVSARKSILASEKTPAAFMVNRELRLERLHLEALCALQDFEQKQTDESRRLALDRWYEIKSELRTSRDHPWYREADKAMQRIAGR